MRAAGRAIKVRPVAQTYLVECFWPGVTEPARDEAAARAAAANQLRASGREVRFLDTLLVPGDEVVFFRFAAPSSGDVEHASTLAQLPFERVTEYREARDPADEAAAPDGGSPSEGTDGGTPPPPR